MRETFPSPAEEELADSIPIEQYFVPHKSTSFFVRVSGGAMAGAGILPGDFVVVERGRVPQNNDIVIAQYDGAWLIRRLEKNRFGGRLVDTAQKTNTLIIDENVLVTGVVTSVLRKYH